MDLSGIVDDEVFVGSFRRSAAMVLLGPAEISEVQTKKIQFLYQYINASNHFITNQNKYIFHFYNIYHGLRFQISQARNYYIN